MSDAQQEPSMEEILASIRKIISEDGEEEGQDAAGEEAEEDAFELDDEDLPESEPEPDLEPEPEPEPEMGAEEEEELLDLSEEVEDEPFELEDELEEEPLDLEEEVEDIPEIEFADLEAEPEPEPEPEFEPEPAPPPPPPPPPVPAPEPPAQLAENDRIVSEPTAAAGSAAFLALEQSIRMGQAGETLEDVVKGLLRPMLRSWLDENLPDMVERLVRAEIEKMAGGARRRGDDGDMFD
ncbi:PopZ family protein [Hwanghaeella sp.]|uniref:PopZ family protein n=1 Tax=Hwanghaeella sp. TaxID=2605943 RepID=UPI003CCC367B